MNKQQQTVLNMAGFIKPGYNSVSCSRQDAERYTGA
nr:Rop family plasmid primer RNA-binding protein [Shigella sonnei]